jgi:uncharacterized membrane protein
VREGGPPRTPSAFNFVLVFTALPRPTELGRFWQVRYYLFPAWSEEKRVENVYPSESGTSSEGVELEQFPTLGDGLENGARRRGHSCNPTLPHKTREGWGNLVRRPEERMGRPPVLCFCSEEKVQSPPAHCDIGIERSPLVNLLRLVSAGIALIVLTMLLGAGVYESVVVAPNLQGAPTSLEHARGFYHVTNPGMFFRVLSPATQILLLLALLCNWMPVPLTRWRLAVALVLAISGDVITFKFHYPRNAILFINPLTGSAADLDRIGSEWAAGNYVRIAVIFIAVVLVIVSVIRIARDTAPRQQPYSSSST